MTELLKHIEAWISAYPAAIVAMASAFVALAALLISVRNMRVVNSVSLMKQIQDINLAIARDEKLAALIAHEDYGGRSAAWIQLLYVAFYQINIFFDAEGGRKRWLIPKQHTVTAIDDILVLVANRSPEQLEFILTGHRGY